MKKLNILSTLSVQQQYELYYWFLTSIFLFISIIAIAGYSMIPLFLQYNNLKNKRYTLQQKTSRYRELMDKKNNAKKEYEIMQGRENKINKYNSFCQSFHAYLLSLYQVIPSSIQLQSIECKKKEFMIHLISNSTQDIQVFVEQLSASDKFKEVILYSLEKKQLNQWICTIKIHLL